VQQTHLISLLLAFLLCPAVLHEFVVQIVQNFSTFLYKFNDTFLLNRRALDPFTQSAAACILRDQIELEILRLEDVDNSEHILWIPLLHELLQNIQLSIPLSFLLPLLRFFKLLQHHFIIVVILHILGLVLPQCHVDNSKPTPPQKLISLDLVLTPITFLLVLANDYLLYTLIPSIFKPLILLHHNTQYLY
jgi:hypothetical protein